MAQAGEVRSAIFPETLALGGLDRVVPYPVADNVASEAGAPYTGVVVQYEADGILDALASLRAPAAREMDP